MTGKPRRRFALRMTYIEGSLYAVMVGTVETFALVYAVKQALTPTQIALMSTLPVIFGVFAQWMVPRLVDRGRLKATMIAGLALQICGIAGILAAFGRPDFFTWILGALSLYWIGGMSVAPVWIDWVSPWLPTARFARYLSRRNAWISLVTLLSYAGAAAWLSRDGGLAAFKAVVAAAFIARLACCLMILLQPSPPLSHVAEAPQAGSSDLGPIKLMIFFTVLFRFAANVSGPFFLPYMLYDLKFDILRYTLIAAMPLIGRWLFLGRWGEAARGIHPHAGLLLGMLFISVNPFLWSLTRHLGMISLLEVLSGIAWGGTELCSLILLHQLRPGRARGIIGLHLALLSAATLAGALVGSRLLEQGWTYLELFRFSSGLRLPVTLAFAAALRQKGSAHGGWRGVGAFLGLVVNPRRRMQS